MADQLVFAAALIAAGEGRLDLSVVKALRKRRVRKILVREFEKWRAERELDNLNVVALTVDQQSCCDNVRSYLKRLFPNIDFDGSFLEAFLTFLIENKEEIFELIKMIIGFIGMFGLLRDSKDPIYNDASLFALANGITLDELETDPHDGFEGFFDFLRS